MSFKIFYIEGNIGSGKSTLIQQLKSQILLMKSTENNNSFLSIFKETISSFYNLVIGNKFCLYIDDINDNDDKENIIFLEEPLEEWNKIKDDEEKNILQNFYEDQYKYSFAFQVMSLQTRSKQLRNVMEKYPQGATIISERSIFTDKDIFCKMLYDDGKINTLEIQIYNLVFQQTQELLIKTEQNRIYLRSSPEETYIRKCGRNRVGEENITLEYLQKCHNYHEEEFLINSDIIIDIDKYRLGTPEYTMFLQKLLKKIELF